MKTANIVFDILGHEALIEVVEADPEVTWARPNEGVKRHPRKPAA